MSPTGSTPDDRAAALRGGERVGARLPGLDILSGETLALVGSGADRLLDRAAIALPWCAWVDGQAAAAAGTIRVHAQQAARVGVRAIAVTGPVDVGLGGPGRGLAVADLAGLGTLGLTVVVEVADAGLGALFADRVIAVRDGAPVGAYAVASPTPRQPSDVRAVTEQVGARLRASA